MTEYPIVVSRRSRILRTAASWLVAASIGAGSVSAAGSCASGAPPLRYAVCVAQAALDCLAELDPAELAELNLTDEQHAHLRAQLRVLIGPDREPGGSQVRDQATPPDSTETGPPGRRTAPQSDVGPWDRSSDTPASVAIP